MFWFERIPPPFVPLIDRLILVVSISCVAISLFAPVAYRRYVMDRIMRDAITSAKNTLLIFGCIGLILYGFAFERVPYLSMRIFWLPLIVWFVWRCLRHDRRIRVEIPQIQHKRMEREKFEKWLPKPKR